MAKSRSSCKRTSEIVSRGSCLYYTAGLDSCFSRTSLFHSNSGNMDLHPIYPPALPSDEHSKAVVFLVELTQMSPTFRLFPCPIVGGCVDAVSPMKAMITNTTRADNFSADTTDLLQGPSAAPKAELSSTSSGPGDHRHFLLANERGYCWPNVMRCGQTRDADLRQSLTCAAS